MKMRAALVGLAVGVAVTAAARGEAEIHTDAASRVESPPSLRGVIREEDVSLLFDYLRLALDAAMAGKEAPPPEALERRAEAIASELQRRGALAGMLMLSMIEKRVKEALRDTPPEARPGLPAVSPFIPVRSLH